MLPDEFTLKPSLSFSLPWNFATSAILLPWPRN
jgi:hypothetical protein